MQEKHCNEAALQAAVLSRHRGIIPTPSVSISASNLNTKDAALLAIQRHQKKNMEEFWVFFILRLIEKKFFILIFFVYKKNANDEGPLTKSIRLLAALTLRNLSRNSDKAKACIQPYAATLANIAFDLMESSSTIANCLWYLSH